MKKHWVNFTATIYGSILVEGDSGPSEASVYVKKHLDITAECEGEDAEINEQQIIIDDAYEEQS